ncbi:MAG: hypothetical protein CMD02_05050 [Flavobacteriales bacterium]|nr:hypothetical protein [Flavobacteriales bacterium]|tara:strand:+ start:1279 stop:1737 length:459 start_codon:yes stop_codon:yes gene_type:complete
MPYMLDGRQLRVGRPFKTSDGVSYSQLWSTQLTAEEKTAIGITYEADPAPFDSLYYTSPNTPRDVDEIKPILIKQQKDTAASMLYKTDWYVTRKAETDTAIPSAVTTFRAAVRTACTAREGEITAAANTAALETLMNTAPGQSGALTQWPEE